MAQEHFVVVVYDISNNKRRTRLHKRLKDFGTPVQYSVFECILSKKELGAMKKTVSKITKPRLDHVRYYELCANCRAKVKVSGRREVTQLKETVVV